MLVNFNPAVGVRFRGAENPAVPDDFFSRPGAYTRTDVQENTEKTDTNKKSGVGKKALWTVVTLAVIAAALAALRKGLPDIFKVERDTSLTGVKKYLDYVTTGIGKAGEYITEKCGKLVNVFKKKNEEQGLQEIINDMIAETEK